MNLVRRSAYAQKTVRTDAEGRGAKLSRVGKGIPNAYLAFGFGAKLNILGATSRVARVKNID